MTSIQINAGVTNAPKEIPLSMVRGDTFPFDIRLKDVEAEIVSIDFSVKRKKDDTEYVVHKSFGDGVTLIAENLYRVRVAPEDTADVPGGRYVYDLQIGAGADVFTLMMGSMSIKDDVTR